MDRGTRLTFSKKERLYSTKLIGEIFERGTVINTSLFRVAWLQTSGLPSPAQVAFAIPKKNIGLAVTRNLIRRRLREAYRLHKQTLYNILCEHDIQIVFMIIYRQKSIPDFEAVEKAVIEIIARLEDRIAQGNKIC